MKPYCCLLCLILFSCKEEKIEMSRNKIDSLRYKNLVDISGIYKFDEFKFGHETNIVRKFIITISIYDFQGKIEGYYRITDMNTWDEKSVTGKLYLASYDTIKFNNYAYWERKYISDTTKQFGNFEIWCFQKDFNYKMASREIKIFQNSSIPKIKSIYGEYVKIDCNYELPHKIIPLTENQ